VELLQDGIIRRGASKTTGVQEHYPGFFDKAIGAGAYVLPALLLILALYLPTGFPASILPVMNVQKLAQAQVPAFFDSLDLQRVRYALESFYCKNGHYPQSLSELVNAGLISDDTVFDNVMYVKKRLHYELGFDVP
jgi:hypothetical protein